MEILLYLAIMCVCVAILVIKDGIVVCTDFTCGSHVESIASAANVRIMPIGQTNIHNRI